MTSFWREGFWRTSVNGNEHWVEGHEVDRDAWDRNAGTDSNESARFCLSYYRALGSSSARFVNPNANCPVCGAHVFFYQNQFGSRVYFDELGPPWPKHPCTDTGQCTPPLQDNSMADEVEPFVRSDKEMLAIRYWLGQESLDWDSDFLSKYASKPWAFAMILKRIKGPRGVFLVLNHLPVIENRKLFFQCDALPRRMAEGYVVLLKKRSICFFDISTMEPKEFDICRIPTAAKFINEMTAEIPDPPVETD